MDEREESTGQEIAKQVGMTLRYWPAWIGTAFFAGLLKIEQLTELVQAVIPTCP